MVINHLEKLFVTSDASTIVNELEIQHPAARLIVLAAQAQEQEIGDATNFVSMLVEAQHPWLCWLFRHEVASLSAGFGVCWGVVEQC